MTWRTKRRESMMGVFRSTPSAHDHSSTIPIMVQVLREGTWCAFVAAQEIGCSRRFGILVSFEREAQEQVTPVLVERERRHVMTWTMLVPTKFIHQLGHNRVALRCDTEPATEALARCIRTSCSRGDPDRSRDTT